LTERDKVENTDKSDGASSAANSSPAVPAKKKRGNPNITKYSFKPGQSGNPSGRREIPPAIKAKIDEGAEESIPIVIDIMKNVKMDPRVRLAAAEMLQSRSWGKPTQAVEANVTTTNVQQAHLQVLVELQHRRDQAMKTIEADEGGTQMVEWGGAENPIEIEPET
jgi:hypothetical protein